MSCPDLKSADLRLEKEVKDTRMICRRSDRDCDGRAGTSIISKKQSQDSIFGSSSAQEFQPPDFKKRASLVGARSSARTYVYEESSEL